MGAGPFGTGFAQSNFSFDPNISPNNQAFGQAVIAVVRRSGVGGTGGTGGGGTGSVTSVGLTEDGGTGLFAVTGSPVTTAGVINLALNTQSKNTVLAGPRSGAAAQPAFRTIALGTDLSDVTITAPAIRQPLQWDGTAHWVNGTNYQPLFQRGASFSGGANQIVIPTNNVAVYIPEDCNIIGVEVLTAGGTGSCVLDIWRVPYGSYPPTSGNSITASAKPTITGGVKYKDTTLTGWSTALSADDTLLVNLTSCSVFTYVMLVLTMQPVGSTTYNGYTNAQAIAAVAGQLAAPTNKVSGTATAGTSTFFMRADGAPALDWAQSPAWTGTHAFTPAVGTAITVTAPTGTGVGVQVTQGGAGYGIRVLAVTGSQAGIAIGGNGNTPEAGGLKLFQDSSSSAYVSSGGTGTFQIFVNGTLMLSFVPNGSSIQGRGPVAAGLVDMTPDRTTYISTLGQGAANLHGTATIYRNGNMVQLWVPIIAGTAAGATGTSVLTIPMVAAFQNSGTLFQMAAVQGNGTTAVGGVAYSGTTFTLTPTIFAGTFTGTLNRGLPQGLLMSWGVT